MNQSRKEMISEDMSNLLFILLIISIVIATFLPFIVSMVLWLFYLKGDISYWIVPIFGTIINITLWRWSVIFYLKEKLSVL